jgi:TonB-dependent starch-binding outer membrane protein SusC
MQRIFIFIVSLCCSFTSLAQSITVSGSVIDADTRQLLPGATILVEGSTNGTTTDFDGNFSISVNNGDTLTFNYIGYQTQSQLIDQSTNLTIELISKNELDEVVVVGYGTQKRSNLVGSVATIEVDKATQTPTTNVTELLRGRAAGVQVNLGDARPGGFSNIVIRGNVSVAGGNNPLIIVDGLPYDNLNDISANDISSIEVLKDAASTAIYGSRASNGVILITTKKANEGYTSFNYSGYVTTQTLTKNFDMYEAEDFIEYKTDAKSAEFGRKPPFALIFKQDWERDLIDNKNFVNWEDLALQDALLTNHSMSYSTGTDKTSIYSSLNYFTQEGIIPNSGYDRVQYKLNLTQKLTDKLSLDAILNIQHANNSFETGGLFLSSISPIAKPFDENGEIVKYYLGEANSTSVNPLWDQRESTNETETNLNDLSLRLNYAITPKLSYSLKTFFRNRHTDQGQYLSSRHSGGDEGTNGYGALIDTKFNQILVEHILSYNILDNDLHKLDFTGVHAYDEQNYTYNELQKSDFLNDGLSYNGLASELLNNYRGVSRRRSLSFMGRVRYSYLDKYLLEATTRADGASVFAENNKWGYFPAVSVAYKAEEDIKSDFVDQLKFRLSYGLTGNQGINSNESLGVADYKPYIFETTVVGGSAASSRLRNPDLKWESTATLNAGVDFGFFTNKLRGTLEYYKTNTTDLLLDRSLNPSTGYTVTRFNVGELQNSGLELSLNAAIMQSKDFNLDLGINWSTNQNEIIALTGETQIDSDTNEEYFIDIIDSSGRRLSIGQSINNLWIPEFAGIYQEADFISGSPIVPVTGAKAGSIRVIDVNGDGEIDTADNVYINADPDWFGSFNTTFRYKNFDLFMDWYTVQGVTRVNSVLADGEFWKASKNGPVVPYYSDEAPSTTWPKPNSKPAWLSNLTSFAAQDASYIRLRTLTLGYNFGSTLNKFLKTTKGRLYFTGSNLLTFTDFLSYSPEQDLREGVFPETLNLTLGVNLTF